MTYIIFAISMLLLPFRWLISFLVCAAIHETAHVFCARCMGIQITDIMITVLGARIYTHVLTNTQELLCAVAGPLFGLLPVVLYRYFPEAALISIILSAYNLLPIYPSDGARILRCVLRWVVPQKNYRSVAHMLEMTVVLICGLLCVFAAIRMKSIILLVIVAFWLPLRIKIEIQLAKQKKKKYNSPINTQEVPL